MLSAARRGARGLRKTAGLTAGLTASPLAFARPLSVTTQPRAPSNPSSQSPSPSKSKRKNKHDASTIDRNSSLNNLSIATKQQLYMTHRYSPGSIFFLPNGAKLFNKLISFIKIQETKKLGFQEVVTPLMFKKDLFDISNHWQYYNDDMFKIYRKKDGSEPESEPSENTLHECSQGHLRNESGHSDHMEAYALKPMNCPGHCLIYKQFPKTYSDLPVKYSDFSSLHRNESSGSLSGLTRVRRFHQDDGHIFCSFEHLEGEIVENLKLVELVYLKFGLDDFKILLSTRPKGGQFIGEEKDWERAEAILVDILNKHYKKAETLADGSGGGKLAKTWEINEGDGAFYGPKIDIILNDRFNKFHQAATIQLDFQLPKNFELSYQVDERTASVGAASADRSSGKGDPSQLVSKTPIIIHRAIFGSVERFLAILMDHYNGKWPFWLNPHQAKIVPVSSARHGWYARYVEQYLLRNGTDCLSLEEFKQRYGNLQTQGAIGKDNGLGDKFAKLAPLTTHEFNIEVDDRAEPLGKRIKDAYGKSFNYLITVGDEEVEKGMVALKDLRTNEVEKVEVQEVLRRFVELEREYE